MLPFMLLGLYLYALVELGCTYYLHSSFGLMFVLVWWDHTRFKPLVNDKSKASFYKELDGKDVTSQIREAVYKRDGGRCLSCGCKTYLRRSKPTRGWLKKHKLAHCNHKFPDDWGADASMENCMNTCETCNLKFSNAITAWSIDYMKELWKQGKPYKLYLTPEERDKLYKPNWRRA